MRNGVFAIAMNTSVVRWQHVIHSLVQYVILFCPLFRTFLIAKIDVAFQLTKLWLKKVTTTTTTTFTTTFVGGKHRIFVTPACKHAQHLMDPSMDRSYWVLVGCSAWIQEIDRKREKKLTGRTFVSGRGAAGTASVIRALIPRDLRRGGARSHTPQRHRVALLSNHVRHARLLGVYDARRNCAQTVAEKWSKVYGYSSSQSNLQPRYGNSHAIQAIQKMAIRIIYQSLSVTIISFCIISCV